MLIFSFGPRPILHLNSAGCEPVLAVQPANALITSRDADVDKRVYSESSKDLSSSATEGGVQTNYYRGGSTEIVEQRFYGETGRAYLRFYYSGQNIFAVFQLRQEYEQPLSEAPVPLIAAVTEDVYYLSGTGEVCTWRSNGVDQTITVDTNAMISAFLSGVR